MLVERLLQLLELCRRLPDLRLRQSFDIGLGPRTGGKPELLLTCQLFDLPGVTADRGQRRRRALELIADVLERAADIAQACLEQIILTEQAWKLSRERKLEEADKAIEAAMALREDFEMGWIFRLNRAFDDLYDKGGGDASDKVRELTARCRQKFPEDEWTWQYVARFHFFENRYGEALEAYRKAHETDPADTNNLNFLGECYHRMGKGQQAFETWQKALGKQVCASSRSQRRPRKRAAVDTRE